MMSALFVFKTGVRLKYWVYKGGGEGGGGGGRVGKLGPVVAFSV